MVSKVVLRNSSQGRPRYAGARARARSPRNTRLPVPLAGLMDSCGHGMTASLLTAHDLHACSKMGRSQAAFDVIVLAPLGAPWNGPKPDVCFHLVFCIGDIRVQGVDGWMQWLKAFHSTHSPTILLPLLPPLSNYIHHGRRRNGMLIVCFNATSPTKTEGLFRQIIRLRNYPFTW